MQPSMQGYVHVEVDDRLRKLLNIIFSDEFMQANTNFEKNMSDLENIVTELEKGDLNLDESISKFEEGIKISKQCNKILENAEKKITILLENNGEVKEENFVSEE